MVRKKIRAATITVSHIKILKTSEGCLKPLAAKAIAITQQVIEITNST